MKRKTNFVGCLVLFAVFLMLLVSNAHAFLITTEVGSFNIQLVPKNPGSNMSLSPIEEVYIEGFVEAYQGTGHITDPDEFNSDTDEIYTYSEPQSASCNAKTEHASVTASVSKIDASVNYYDASINFNISEDTSDFMGGYSELHIGSAFMVHGEGWVLISAVHHTAFGNNSSTNLDSYSDLELSLNYGHDDGKYDSHIFSGHQYENRHDENSSVLTDDLEIGAYFYDGQVGYLSTKFSGGLQYNVTYPEPNPNIPIPGAVWLFSSGLFCLGALRRRGRR